MFNLADYNPNNPVASHFTQVVWKGTTQVGCAVQLCDGVFSSNAGVSNYKSSLSGLTLTLTRNVHFTESEILRLRVQSPWECHWPVRVRSTTLLVLYAHLLKPSLIGKMYRFELAETMLGIVTLGLSYVHRYVRRQDLDTRTFVLFVLEA